MTYESKKLSLRGQSQKQAYWSLIDMNVEEQTAAANKTGELISFVLFLA
jgi:hypothetical protein